jgi:hypothetical protein
MNHLKRNIVIATLTLALEKTKNSARETNQILDAPNPIRVSPLLFTSNPRSAFLVPLLFPPGPLSNSLRSLASLALSVPRCCVSTRKAKVMRYEF